MKKFLATYVGTAIVDQGAPLGKTKRTGLYGISDIRNAMTGYVVVQAESHEAAARMFESHPHFVRTGNPCYDIDNVLPF